MEDPKKTLLYNLGALLCAVWFLATAWIWIYYANLVFSYPVGIAGYFLWKKAKDREAGNLLNTYTFWILATGLFISLAYLAVLLYYN